MPIRGLLAALAALRVAALNNGLARTPPCGLNSYMSGGHGAAFLARQGDFFIATGMRESCFVYLNTDEGWEEAARDNVTHRLVPSLQQYPNGIKNFTAELAARGLKFGLYGAASGVTCGGVSGQLGFEDLDVATFVDWGVAYLKSDNCASYAMDSSVRFAATRDALLRANAQIVYSIEPFSISPDLLQSARVANVYRISQDIGRAYADAVSHAAISDKWAPLAGPGSWSDPDMIFLGPQKSVAETRFHFGVYCLMKAPLLLSNDLAALAADVQAVITNPEVVRVNQDPLGVQGRKLLIDGAPLPWLVGLERCDHVLGGGITGMRARGWPATPLVDTREWATRAHGAVAGALLVVNAATGRCLQNGTAMGLATVVLLPCDAASPDQAWSFSPNAHTVAALVHSATGLALTVGAATLWSSQGAKADLYNTSAAAYGNVALGLANFSGPGPCASRDCQDYEPAALWYLDVATSFIAQATYTASINHCSDGACYELTAKQPTAAHECLAHVLSIRNRGTDVGAVSEVWGGPLEGGAFVLGLWNARDSGTANVTAPFTALGADGINSSTSFCVRDLWARKNVGVFTGSFSAAVASHDFALFKLSPGACA
jgi:hypothetical protein